MTLSTCPACKRDVSNSAKTCPHCGDPLKKLRGRPWWQEALLGLLFFGSLIFFYYIALPAFGFVSFRYQSAIAQDLRNIYAEKEGVDVDNIYIDIVQVTFLDENLPFYSRSLMRIFSYFDGRAMACVSYIGPWKNSGINHGLLIYVDTSERMRKRREWFAEMELKAKLKNGQITQKQFESMKTSANEFGKLLNRRNGWTFEVTFSSHTECTKALLLSKSE